MSNETELLFRTTMSESDNFDISTSQPTILSNGQATPVRVSGFKSHAEKESLLSPYDKICWDIVYDGFSICLRHNIEDENFGIVIVGNGFPPFALHFGSYFPRRLFIMLPGAEVMVRVIHTFDVAVWSSRKGYTIHEEQEMRRTWDMMFQLSAFRFDARYITSCAWKYQQDRDYSYAIDVVSANLEHTDQVLLFLASYRNYDPCIEPETSS